jgi:hypothetical protein
VKSPCPVPGCPTLVEAIPGRYYCDRHDELNGDLGPLLEDEARGVLRELLADARADLALPEAGAPGRTWDRYTASQVAVHVPEVLGAAEAGEAWTAVRHALWVGLMAGHSRNAPDQHRLRQMEPHAARGRGVLAGARKAGEARRGSRKGPPDDVLRAAVAEKRIRSTPGASWTAITDRVGSDHALSGKTVRRRVPDTRWS